MEKIEDRIYEPVPKVEDLLRQGKIQMFHLICDEFNGIPEGKIFAFGDQYETRYVMCPDLYFKLIGRAFGWDVALDKLAHYLCRRIEERFAKARYKEELKRVLEIYSETGNLVFTEITESSYDGSNFKFPNADDFYYEKKNPLAP